MELSFETINIVNGLWLNGVFTQYSWTPNICKSNEVTLKGSPELQYAS